MRWLARMLGRAADPEDEGIRLVDAEPWRVEAKCEVGTFFRALRVVAPADSIAYFECIGEQHVAEYLGRVAIAPSVRVAQGTIWPRPDCYHVPLGEGMAERLAGFLDGNQCGFFCAHIHVYCGRSVLLRWYDAFSDPMYLARSVGERSVKEFAEALGGSYGTGW